MGRDSSSWLRVRYTPYHFLSRRIVSISNFEVRLEQNSTRQTNLLRRTVLELATVKGPPKSPQPKRVTRCRALTSTASSLIILFLERVERRKGQPPISIQCAEQKLVVGACSVHVLY